MPANPTPREQVREADDFRVERVIVTVIPDARRAASPRAGT